MPLKPTQFPLRFRENVEVLEDAAVQDELLLVDLASGDFVVEPLAEELQLQLQSVAVVLVLLCGFALLLLVVQGQFGELLELLFQEHRVSEPLLQEVAQGGLPSGDVACDDSC